MNLGRAIALGLCGTLAILGQQPVKNLRYEGGSLPLDQHSKVTVTVDSETITFIHGQQQFAMRASRVTAIFYGRKVQQHVKSAVAAGLLMGPLGS
jgi:hypothetical protein